MIVRQLLAGLDGLAAGAAWCWCGGGAGPAGGQDGDGVSRAGLAMAGDGAGVVGFFAGVRGGRCAECGEALGRLVDWSLMDVVRGLRGAPWLDRVDVVQPVLWAVMVSLAAVVAIGGCGS